MGTRSNIFVEKEDGKHIGVCCYYDGYPDHMLEHLQHCSHEELYDSIVIAGAKGGYRLFSPKDNETEFLEDAPPHYVFDPDDDDALSIDYVYVKCFDGTLKWRKYRYQGWTFSS
jgi:methylmalonyl-CoA mutase cobalamin-binding subunit